MIKTLVIAVLSIIFIYGQGDFDLEDLNPLSETYGQIIGPEDFLGSISIIFFGHEY